MLVDPDLRPQAYAGIDPNDPYVNLYERIRPPFWSQNLSQVTAWLPYAISWLEAWTNKPHHAFCLERKLQRAKDMVERVGQENKYRREGPFGGPEIFPWTQDRFDRFQSLNEGGKLWCEVWDLVCARYYIGDKVQYTRWDLR